MDIKYAHYFPKNTITPIPRASSFHADRMHWVSARRYDSTGTGFYTTWDNHNRERNDDEFKTEFNNVVDSLRFDERLGGLLKNRSS